MSKITEVRPQTIVNKEYTIGVNCDICKSKHIGHTPPKNWFILDAHHASWGNDSIDSWEYRDVCSVNCYIIALEYFISDFEKYDTSIINGMGIAFAKKILEHMKKCSV